MSSARGHKGLHPSREAKKLAEANKQFQALAEREERQKRVHAKIAKRKTTEKVTAAATVEESSGGKKRSATATVVDVSSPPAKGTKKVSSLCHRLPIVCFLPIING